MLVDSHCHLDRLKLKEANLDHLDQVIHEATKSGVEYLLCVGIDMSNAAQVKKIAETYPRVFSSVGVHPLDISQCIDADVLIKAASHPKVIAIGETGLDYFYSSDSAEVQQESLIMHLQVAEKLDLPVIIHTRQAKQDTLDILAQHARKEKPGVLHCFTEDLDMAKQAIDLGFYISFSGIVTFKNAAELQQVAKEIPLERMLVETDSPYLTPVPFRGKPNFPKYTREVAEFIANIRQQSFNTIAEVTTNNFFDLFEKAYR